jgi:hypothetical protein
MKIPYKTFLEFPGYYSENRAREFCEFFNIIDPILLGLKYGEVLNYILENYIQEQHAYVVLAEIGVFTSLAGIFSTKEKAMEKIQQIKESNENSNHFFINYRHPWIQVVIIE